MRKTTLDGTGDVEPFRWEPTAHGLHLTRAGIRSVSDRKLEGEINH